MRRMLFGMTAAAVVAGVLVFSTSAAAGESKPCWDHVEGNGEYTRVWTNGGSHGTLHDDLYYGDFETRAECEAATVVIG